MTNGIGPSEGGSFDGNNAKDVYARFDVKVGGMGLDGDMGSRNIPDKNWRDNSIRVGVFAYRGDGSDINFALTGGDGTIENNVQDIHFMRSGVYASLFVQDLNVFGAYLHGTDSLQAFDPASAVLLSAIEPDFHAFFTQADYLLYPWLQASGRYEALTPADPDAEVLKTCVLSLNALVRANVKAMVEYQRDVSHGENHSLNAIVRFAF
jgi:hypothetical protein